MGNFDIIRICEDSVKMLIVMKTSDSPFEYVEELQQILKEIQFEGNIVIDCLLHNGNTEERFICGFFDGFSFDNTKFRYENVARKSIMRNYICEYLKQDEELLMYSGLTINQQKLILKGCII